jgi:hypothetical protein
LDIIAEKQSKEKIKMNREKFIKILDGEGRGWEGDNAIQGLKIIEKYIDPQKTDLIQGAEHDIIWSVGIDKLIEAGITEQDAEKLRDLNWMVEDDEYLACYV